jgi:hypothetical protein
MISQDKELKAISSIIALLKPLDPNERSRVLEYVLKRLEMATVSMSAVGAISAVESVPGLSSDASRFRTKDIRSFTAEKQPRSITEMVAVLAYYLAELAPDTERSHTINTDAVKRYFKMAGFPLPTVLRSAVTNAAAAGYLENVGKGEYRLNPVGYNLVVHGLPKGGTAPAAAPKPRLKRKPKRRKGS